MKQAMRILFLSSCLEPGRDGVGDYVRLLAEACIRQGHVCGTVALNDSFVTTAAMSSPDSQDQIPSLRLPAVMSWGNRVAAFRQFRESFRPDWISFHLVPYAFNRKGVLFGTIAALRKLTGGVPLHLMFHELYLGAERGASFRHKIVGRIQSAAIGRLLSQLDPKVVTASNPVYVAMLKNRRDDASVLPLFGNVPIVNFAAQPTIDIILPGSGITAENRSDWWIGIFFGAMHGQWKPEPLFGLLLRAAKRANKRVCLVLAGRSSRKIWSRLQEEYSRHISLLDLGELPLPTLSALLQTADFGIACSPWQLIGKSGTVAAMCDHGLPVIVTRDDFRPVIPSNQSPSTDPLMHLYGEDLEEKMVVGLNRRAPRHRVDEVAAQLCAELARTGSSLP